MGAHAAREPSSRASLSGLRLPELVCRELPPVGSSDSQTFCAAWNWGQLGTTPLPSETVLSLEGSGIPRHAVGATHAANATARLGPEAGAGVRPVDVAAVPVPATSGNERPPQPANNTTLAAKARTPHEVTLAGLHELLPVYAGAPGIIALASIGLGWPIAGPVLRRSQTITRAARDISRPTFMTGLRSRAPMTSSRNW